MYHLADGRLTARSERLLNVPDAQKRAWLGTLLADYLAATLEDVADNRETGALARVLEQLRLPENIGGGVPRFMELAGYSRAQLCRLTRKYYDKTPHELLSEVKMQAAREYIENTDRSFERIAADIGYTSLSSFYAAVRSFFGKTPGELRGANRYRV